MNVIEKIAGKLVSPRGLAELYRRVITGKKSVFIGKMRFPKSWERPISRKKALTRALRATKRVKKKLVGGKGPELAGAAAGLGAAVPTAYAISKKKETK